MADVGVILFQEAAYLEALPDPSKFRHNLPAGTTASPNELSLLHAGLKFWAHKKIVEQSEAAPNELCGAVVINKPSTVCE